MTNPWGGAPLAQSATALAVHLDTEGRIAGVTFTRLADEDRVPSTVNEAFQAALTAALADGRPTADVLDSQGRARAARVTAPSRPPLRDLVEQSIRFRDLDRERARVRPTGGERGVSDNECVTVGLDLAGPGGQLDFDAGWLRQAQPANVGAGIEQAFTAAYNQRGTR